ncbi:acyltransferase [Agrococcus sp. TF02-05]|uniref:acyltransferase family protein n=1 Tax=Agrococcus sp. TF02-05 TaxID=2815211 RepID=UPI001AA16AAB|nr:acyltransferase [Agrococcus sp. TF02-05]MBO1770708.1 acyltransferase [Agrococcus sp. TF02-05]
MTETSVAPPKTGRMHWMDGLRGTAIVLIMVLHAAEMLRSIGMPPDEGVAMFNTIASPFRIPLLMVLSGMLLGTSLSKGPGRYLVGKLRAIAWPYVVWLLLLLAVFPSLGIETVVRGLVAPNTYLWYLHTLLIAYLAALAMRRLPAWLRTLAPLALALVVSRFELPEAISMLSPQRTLVLLSFFFAGDLLMQNLPRWLPLLRHPVAILIGAASAVAVVAIVLPPEGPGSGDAIIAPLVIAAIAAGIGLLSRAPWRNPLARALRWVGKHSIVFYVSHWITMYWGLNLFAEPLMREGPTALGAAMVAFGLVVGTAVAWLVQLRTPVRFLFRL